MSRRVALYVRACPPSPHDPHGWPQEVREADYEPHEFEMMQTLARRVSTTPSGSQERSVALGELCTLHEFKVFFPGSRFLTVEEEVEAGFRSQFQIPERARPAQQALSIDDKEEGMYRCAECGQEFETKKGAAFEAIGWEQERDQGGTNHVMFRVRTGRIMCPDCIRTRRTTGSAQQEALALDAPT